MLSVPIEMCAGKCFLCCLGGRAGSMHAVCMASLLSQAWRAPHCNEMQTIPLQKAFLFA